MAALTFQYRSKKNKAPLEARLSFTHEDGRFSYYTRSKVEVTKDFWNDYRKGVNFRDAEKANLKKDVDDDIHDLRTYVLNEFDRVDTPIIDKDWLKKTIHDFYNPPKPETAEVIPHSLIGYWDYYVKLRKNELSKGYLKLFATIKQKLQRFEKETFKTLKIKDINERFKSDFVDYCNTQNYSQSTIRKDIKCIKAVCRHARTKGIEVSSEIDVLKVKNETLPKVYLSFSELDKINKVKGLPEYLDNARDWLIISCYTGQRVSDFMRFNKSMLRNNEGKTFLDVNQVKTGKTVTIPVLPEVIEVLDSRNGDFPRPISDQRYNEWIKEVCKRAKINDKTQGRLATNINPDPDGETQIRNVLGEYLKWQLVTSHTGRRSFATNYYGKLPTSYLKNITGHGSEAIFLSYIGKSSKDTAFEAYELLLNAK